MNGQRAVRLSLVILWVGLQATWAADVSQVLGTWEGQSLCTVPSSPCHNEHVVYHIRKAAGDDLVIGAYKIVDAREEFMGDIRCRYQPDRLSCSFRTPEEDDWEFLISGKHMDGTLVIGKEKTLYRKVSVDKKSD